MFLKSNNHILYMRYRYKVPELRIITCILNWSICLTLLFYFNPSLEHYRYRQDIHAAVESGWVVVDLMKFVIKEDGFVHQVTEQVLVLHHRGKVGGHLLHHKHHQPPHKLHLSQNIKHRCKYCAQTLIHLGEIFLSFSRTTLSWIFLAATQSFNVHVQLYWYRCHICIRLYAHWVLRLGHKITVVPTNHFITGISWNKVAADNR